MIGTLMMSLLGLSQWSILWLELFFPLEQLQDFFITSSCLFLAPVKCRTWKEKEWGGKINWSVAKTGNSTCLKSPQENSSHKNLGAIWEFFFYMGEHEMSISKWECWGFPALLQQIQTDHAFPPPAFSWSHVHPKGQNRAVPKHNKHYSVCISFYISLFYFLFCLKWPVPQEYNLFNRLLFF